MTFEEWLATEFTPEDMLRDHDGLIPCARRAWEAAVAAERAKWVAAARKADAAGYDHQAFTILHEMGAARE